MLPLARRRRRLGARRDLRRPPARVRRRRRGARRARRRPGRVAARPLRPGGGRPAALLRDAQLALERARGEGRLHRRPRAGGRRPRRRRRAPRRPRAARRSTRSSSAPCCTTSARSAIPESILNKPGPLDDEEWEIMRTTPRPASASSRRSRRSPPCCRSSARATSAGTARLPGPARRRRDPARRAHRLGLRRLPRDDRAAAVPRGARPAGRPRVLVENAGTQFDPACVGRCSRARRRAARGTPVRLNRPHHLRSA